MQCISKVYLFVKMKVSNEILTAETYLNTILKLRTYTVMYVILIILIWRTFWVWNEWIFKYVLLLDICATTTKPNIFDFFREDQSGFSSNIGTGGKHG